MQSLLGTLLVADLVNEMSERYTPHTLSVTQIAEIPRIFKLCRDIMQTTQKTPSTPGTSQSVLINSATLGTSHGALTWYTSGLPLIQLPLGPVRVS